jgi:hypothetical protein
MPSPSFTKVQSSSGTLTLSHNGKKIFQAINAGLSSRDRDDLAKIRVSDLMSKMSFYYEKIRNSVDYREEFVLRRGAIARILKRLVIIEGAVKGASGEAERLASVLLIELIRAGYIANNSLPEAKIAEVGFIIAKYLKLRQAVFYYRSQNRHSKDQDPKQQFTAWLIKLAASEIEDNLSHNATTEALVTSFYDVMMQNIQLPADLPYQNDLGVQVYLSIYRHYLKLNEDEILSFVLWQYYCPAWKNADDSVIDQLALDIEGIRKAINYQLAHPLKNQLNKIVYKYTVYFQILQDILDKNPKKVYEEMHRDGKYFTSLAREACAKRYKQAKSKLWGSVMRSIVYIFLTKSVFVLALEIPAIKFFGEEVSTLALMINICTPAVMLFLAVALTKLPGDDNTAKIISGIEEIIFVEKARKSPLLLKKPTRRGGFLAFFFGLIYAATFILSFSSVVWILHQLHFSNVSMIIFVFFLAFASFFAIRIKRNARSLVVVETKETIFSFLWSFLYIPIVSTGKWLSGKFSSINIFVFFFDFIIEAPFKIFVTVAEEWGKYLNERRENLS